MIIRCHPSAVRRVVARRRPGLAQSAGLGAAGGLLLALWLTSEGVAVAAWQLVLAGMALGAGWNLLRFPDDRTCRIPWWLRGCGGETSVKDTDGHSRPKAPCWGHPGGRPKRLVNLAVVAGEVVVVVVVVVVAVSVADVAP